MSKPINGLEWDKQASSWNSIAERQWETDGGKTVPSPLAATPKGEGSDRTSQPVAPSPASHELTRSEAIWLLVGWCCGCDSNNRVMAELAYWNRQSDSCLQNALAPRFEVIIHG